MSRKNNNFDYLLTSLESNNDFFLYKGIVNKLLFIDSNDYEMIRSNADKYNFNTIFRNENSKYYQNLNSTYSKDSYDYWRSHLCLDFAYSMNKCLEMTDTPLIMWLEDDTIMDINLFTELYKMNNITCLTAYNNGGAGFPCMIFHRDFLIQLIQLIYDNYMDDIPLDYYLTKFNLPCERLTKNYAHHIGKISSRVDSTIIRPVN